MTILHLYPKDAPQLAEYVNMLGGDGDTTSPDIVHVHGCRDKEVIYRALQYKKSRYVLSPHGQMQPWKQKNGNAVMQVRQKQFFSKCYAIIARGKMEQKNLQALGWNPHIEVVRNPIITSTISPETARKQLGVIYQKTIDSNVWELMTPESRTMTACLLKAGIMKDRRYVQQDIPADVNWRHILLYGYQENVIDLISDGMEVMDISKPDIDASHIGYYLPANYQKPAPLHQDAATIVAALRQRPCMRHLVDLHLALVSPDFHDEQLRTMLKDRHLLKYAQRLMAILQELTLLEEGYMPFAPVNDKQTYLIRSQIDNSLSI